MDSDTRLILHGDLSGLLALCTFRPGDSQSVDENLFAVYQVEQNPPLAATGYIEDVISIRTRLVWGSRHRLDGPAEQYFSLTPDGKTYCRVSKWYYGDELHRFNGPARRVFRLAPGGHRYCVTSEWYCGGELHRLDGPAIREFGLTPDGKIYCKAQDWCVKNQIHRLDGPAHEACITTPSRSYGSWQWYVNDKHHRLDGPSVCIIDITLDGCIRGWCYWDDNDNAPHRSDGPCMKYYEAPPGGKLECIRCEWRL